jgi:hypothetical protein
LDNQKENKNESSKKVVEDEDPERDEDYEEEFIWPRRRAARTEKPNQTLGDRFTDYLTMKIASRDKRIGGSMRSLQSSNDAKSESRENLRRLLDFDGDERSISPKQQQQQVQQQVEQEEEEEDLDEAVKIQEVRRAIILNEKKLEEEEIEREKQKEITRLAAIEREAELEARRRAQYKARKQQQSIEDQQQVEEIGKNIDPEKITKIVIVSILILLIPIYYYYDVYVMLFVFVLLLLLWNKFRTRWLISSS